MNNRFPIKYLPDGRAMLNLGCGTKMDWGWNNLDFSYYTRLAPRRRLARVLRGIGVLSRHRYQMVLSVDPDIISWDLRNGVPFPDRSFDVVYHSHVLEHIDYELAAGFIQECYRVLKTNGILRVVVPDLEQLVCAYVESTADINRGKIGAAARHAAVITNMFEQVVRRELAGASKQTPIVRAIERRVRGDARRAGEAHRWMYDRHSLATLLAAAGFNDIRVENPSSSRVAGWPTFELDTDNSGEAHMPGSLYVEALRPG
ncbi:MAG: methyltransferase domain-containing protein [Chloroflexota bacterium]|nr:methyltransferase domain-containing protein [Chloroflexota bacterium]